MDNRLLTVTDVAKVLSISARQVWKLLAARQLPPPLRLGRSVRWPEEELKTWIAAGCPDLERWEIIKRSKETQP